MMKKDSFSEEAYNISIVGKNVQVTDAIKNYVLERISKVERFTSHILDVAVTLDIQKLTHKVSIIMKFFHFKIQVHAATEDLYSAIDKASEKLLGLIRKYKTKLTDHHAKDLTAVDMKVNVLKPVSEVEEINDQIEEENLKEQEERFRIHRIIAEETMPLKTLTHDEAVMKMELSGESFLIFRSEETNKIQVIYRRKDEEYGIVEVN